MHDSFMKRFVSPLYRASLCLTVLNPVSWYKYVLDDLASGERKQTGVLEILTIYRNTSATAKKKGEL